MWFLKLWNNLDLRWIPDGVDDPDVDDDGLLGLESLFDRRLNASKVNSDPDDERPDRGEDWIVGVAALDDGVDACCGDNNPGASSSPPDFLLALADDDSVVDMMK